MPAKRLIAGMARSYKFLISRIAPQVGFPSKGRPGIPGGIYAQILADSFQKLCGGQNWDILPRVHHQQIVVAADQRIGIARLD